MIVILSLRRRCTEKIKGIIHPAHIPLIVETKSLIFNRCGNFKKVCGVLCKKHCTWVDMVQTAVHIADKVYCAVIDTSWWITLPVKHIADSVHSYAVKMKFAEPIVSGWLHKAAYFLAVVVEIVWTPLAHTRTCVRVLIKCCAVVKWQWISVDCKMNGNEVRDNPYSCFMALIDKIFQIVRWAVSWSRAEKACGLITPRAVRRVLAERHYFNMSKAVLFHILNKRFCKLTVCIPALLYRIRLIALNGEHFPWTHMYLINIHRLIIALVTLFHPLFVCEFKAIEIYDNWRWIGTQLRFKAVWVGFFNNRTVFAVDTVFIHLTNHCIADNGAVHAASALLCHILTVPAIKLADDLYIIRIGCIGTEHNSLRLNMRTEICISIKSFAVIKVL